MITVFDLINLSKRKATGLFTEKHGFALNKSHLLPQNNKIIILCINILYINFNSI
jgi:hypothetical protein